MDATQSFGARLREARERTGLTLQQVAAVTKIGPAILEALEANDVSKMPGGIFSRAFVKAYAEEVRLDPAATLQEFLATFEQDVAPISRVVASPVDAPSPTRWFGSIAAGIAIAGLAATGVWTLSQDRLPEAMRAATAPASVTPLPIAPRASQVSPAAMGTGEQAAVAAVPVATQVPADRGDQTIETDGPIRLSFRPQGSSCWVELIVDGKRELAREIAAGQVETRVALDAFDVKVGDAGHCTYTVNDRPGRSLGPVGKVVRVRIDRQTLPQFVQGS